MVDNGPGHDRPWSTMTAAMTGHGPPWSTTDPAIADHGLGNDRPWPTMTAAMTGHGRAMTDYPTIVYHSHNMRRV